MSLLGNAWDWIKDNPLAPIFPLGPFGPLPGSDIPTSIPGFGGDIPGVTGSGGIPGFGGGGGGSGGKKGGGAAPPAMPDFMGLANQMAANDFGLLQYQTLANRPNIYTPYGSLTWAGPNVTLPTGGSGGGWGGGGGGASVPMSGPGSSAWGFHNIPIDQNAIAQAAAAAQGRQTQAVQRGGNNVLAARAAAAGIPYSMSTSGGGGGGGSTYRGTQNGDTYQRAPGDNEPNAPWNDIVTALNRADLSRRETGDPRTYLDAYEQHLTALDGQPAAYPSALARARYEQYGASSLDSYESNLIGLNQGGSGSGGGGGGGGGGGSGGGAPSGGGGGGGMPGTPGSITSGASPWSMFVQLSPSEQAAFDSQQRLKIGRSLLGEGLLGRSAEQLSGDYPTLGAGGSTGARQTAEDAIYQRAASRLDPMWNQRAIEMESTLRNQGLRPGMEAYDRAMADFNRQRTDAYQTAINESVMGGGTEMARSFGIEQAIYQAALARRLQAINEMNAALSGQQTQMPQFPGFQGAGITQGPDIMGAASAMYGGLMNQYNAGQMQNQNFMSGLLGLGKLGLGLI